MKSSISRQQIYLIVASLVLFIFVLIFAFAILIPEGKEYRIKRVDLKKASKELREYKYFYDDTLETYKNLQATNRTIITAFDSIFDPYRFEKQHKKYFSALTVSELTLASSDKDFVTYEVNTTSQINSPKNFYDFLDVINKSDWIIGVNFPINFKRDGELIRSSFTMKVYCDNKDSNVTALESVDK